MKNVMKCLFGLLVLTFVLGCPDPITGGPETSETPTAPTTGIISGRAVYAGVDNHEGIHITVEKLDDTGSKGIAKGIEAKTVTDATGNFTVQDVEPGDYTVYASSPDSVEMAVAVNLTVAAGKTVSTGDLQLTPTGSISGTVIVNGTNTGNLGCTVFIAGTSFVAMTDDSGKFTLSNVPVRTAHTIVVMKGTEQLTTQSVNVTAGIDTAVGTINVTAGGDNSTVQYSDAMTKLLEQIVAFTSKHFNLNVSRDSSNKLTGFDVLTQSSKKIMAITVTYNPLNLVKQIAIDIEPIFSHLDSHLPKNSFYADFSYYMDTISLQVHSKTGINNIGQSFFTGDFLYNSETKKYTLLGTSFGAPLKLSLSYDETKTMFSGEGFFSYSQDFLFSAYYKDGKHLVASCEEPNYMNKELFIDFNALLTEYKITKPNGVIYPHYTFEYSSNNKFSKRTSYEDNGSIKNYYTYQYDANDNLTSTQLYTSNLSLYETTFYTDGVKTRIEYPNSDGTLWQKDEFTDSTYYKIRTKYTYSNGLLQSYTVEKYTNNYSPEVTINYDADGNVIPE